jgi:hypothetical protein
MVATEQPMMAAVGFRNLYRQNGNPLACRTPVTLADFTAIVLQPGVPTLEFFSLFRRAKNDS